MYLKSLPTIPVYKFVFLGNSGVGKTSICSILNDSTYNPNQEPTIGASFLSYRINNLKFQIWDTAGQERYMALTPMYFRGADVCVLVYDVSDLHSFHHLKKWIKEIKERDEAPMFVIFANKIDKIDRIVNKQTGLEFADSLSAAYFEISAKSGDNIKDSFEQIAETLKNIPSKAEVERLQNEKSDRGIKLMGNSTVSRCC